MGGKIYIDNAEKDAVPLNVTKGNGEGVVVRAKLQNDDQGYPRIWNDYQPNYPSKWFRNGVPIDDATSIERSFSVTSNDNHATYEAKLRRNYTISQNTETEFDDRTPTLVATQVVEQNSGTITTPLQETINSKAYKFAGWTDGCLTNTRTVTPTDNMTLTARYKYPNHTQIATALTNTSQRRIVSTLYGDLFKVYESMGHIWLEHSFDYGATWSLCNNGPVDCGQEAKNPALDILPASYKDFSGGTEVYVTYQERTVSDAYTINLARLNTAGTLLSTETIYTSPSNYSNDANPVISTAWYARGSELRKQLVGLWHEGAASGVQAGLYYYAAYYLGSTFVWNNNPSCAWINYTTSNSIHPTIDAFKYDDEAFEEGQLCFHFAWEEGGVNIMSSKIVCGYSGTLLSGLSPVNVSYGDYWPNNYRPSITAISNGEARLAWRGYEDDGSGIMTSVTMLGAPNVPYFFKEYGFYVSNTTINTNYDDLMGTTNYTVGWTETYPSGNIKDNSVAISAMLDDPFSLNTSGRDMQLSNGTDWTSQLGISLSTVQVPYVFQMTPFVASGLGKMPRSGIAHGRSAIVTLDSGTVSFRFLLGDVTLDNKPIKFQALSDTVVLSAKEDILPYLISAPFFVSEQSTLLYGVQSAATDSAKAVSALGEQESVEFRLELLDAQTDEVLGTLNDILFTKSGITSNQQALYSVETKGIGNKMVKLRVTASSTHPIAQYTLVDRHSVSGSVLGKGDNQRVKATLKGGSASVTEYELGQNYPNPFNPSTTISFALPKAGLVSVKVYDILGKEIATVVNEYKNSGRYDVSFNASDLSSGMYIYRIQAGSFTETKKMQLVK